MAEAVDRFVHNATKIDLSKASPFQNAAGNTAKGVLLN